MKIKMKNIKLINNIKKLKMISYLSINKGGKWKIVKKISKIFPDIGIAILAQALIVKSIYLCDLSTLMVSSQDCDAVFESYLEAVENNY